MITRDIVDRMKPGHLVHHYLLASFCYYQLDLSPLTDAAFDRLCVRLLGAFKGMAHQHKKYINEEDLKAGTCLLSVHDYPQIVQYGAENYYQGCIDGSIRKAIEPHLLPGGASPRRSSRTRTATTATEPTPTRIRRTRPVAVPTDTPSEVQSGNAAPTRRIIRRTR